MSIPKYITDLIDKIGITKEIYNDSEKLHRIILEFCKDCSNLTELKNINKQIANGEYDWNNVVTGFNKKKDAEYNIKRNKVYKIDELYSVSSNSDTLFDVLNKYASIVF